MLTAKAVAKILGISPRAVYALGAEGVLPVYRPTTSGKSVLFAESDVQEHIEKCRSIATPKPEPVRYDHRPAKPKLLSKREAARREAERLFSRQTLVAHHAAKRRAERRNRTPPWVDWASIKALHAEARRRAHETGLAHHVDHIIPLQGKLVSGLHVATNMQVLTGEENTRKHNHFEVDEC